MPVKLPFSIIACSGEDPSCPACELLYSSQDSKGWCTPRHCQYPQELVLRLDAPARLTQIQLLCHESRIPAKVEILVSLPLPAAGAAGDLQQQALDPTNVPWKRLGFLSFDTNERTQYTARELKTVGLPGAPAHLVRFVFHRAHANALNVYGQVGIVALCVLGEPLPGVSSSSSSAGYVAAAVPAPLAPITNTPPPFGVMYASMGSTGVPGLQSPAQPVQAAYVPQQAPAAYAAPVALANGRSGGSGPSSPPGGGAAALAAELNVDITTAERIQELQRQKQQAVEREDYDDAKRLKAAIDRLRSAGSKIAALEAKKKAAVEGEDYDLAKQLKQEIDRMRSRVYAAALAGEGSAGELGSSSSSGSVPEPCRGNSFGNANAQEGSRDGQPGGLLPAQQHDPWAKLQPRAGHEQPAAQPQPQREEQQQQPEQQPELAASPSAIDWSKYDDRPAVAKGRYDFSSHPDAASPASGGGSRRGSQAGNSAARAPSASTVGAPPGFPADLPAPEALSAADAKDAGPLEDVLGEYLVRCAYSKKWDLRAAVLQHAADELAPSATSGTGGKADGSGLAGKLSSDPEAYRTLCRLLSRAIADRVVAVFAASLVLLRALAAAAVAAGSSREAAAGIWTLLPLLVDKGADLNARIRELASEVLVHLSKQPELDLRSQTQHFLRSMKPSLTPKIVVGRLQLVAALLPVIGVPGDKRRSVSGGSSGDGFKPEAVMEFAVPCLSHKDNDVRAAAVALIVQLGAQAGPSVQRLLPGDLNAKVKEQIQQGLLVSTSASPAAGGALPVRGTGKPAAQQAVSAAAQKPPPQQAIAAQKQQQSKRSPPISAVAGAAGAPAAAAAAGPQSPGPSLSPALPGSPGAGLLPTGEDDPAPYEAELRSREARLGPSHPDVAEALSNLAIIHNQRGDTAAALPLYERALATWEASVGTDHPDVAHTLTDIAVIHLEQGRDDLGRPLLERALAIQERHLGPDHPDVVAIRDVLQEE